MFCEERLLEIKGIMLCEGLSNIARIISQGIYIYIVFILISTFLLFLHGIEMLSKGI